MLPILSVVQAGDICYSADVVRGWACIDTDSLGKPAIPRVRQLKGVKPVQQVCKSSYVLCMGTGTKEVL